MDLTDPSRCSIHLPWLDFHQPAVGDGWADGNDGGAPVFRQFIGVAEVLAAIGLVLPALTRVRPGLTPLAALGLMVVMVSATIFHVGRGETSSAIFSAVLFALVALTGYLRWRVVPIRTKAAR